jgi:hypothetical protein
MQDSVCLPNEDVFIFHAALTSSRKTFVRKVEVFYSFNLLHVVRTQIMADVKQPVFEHGSLFLLYTSSGVPFFMSSCNLARISSCRVSSAAISLVSK